MKKILSATAVLLAVCELCAVEAIKRDNVYVLKNACLTVEIDPKNGGRVTRLHDNKSGAELTRYFSASQTSAGSGLFADRLWTPQNQQYRHYENSAFEVVSCKAGRERAELKLLCRSRPLDIEKTYILRENERGLRVRYALSNPESVPFTGRFWSGNVITPGEGRYRIMLPEGHYSFKGQGPVRQIVLDHDPKAPVPGNHWSHAPRQDYGCVFNKTIGAAVIAPFEYLEKFYSCFPAGAGADRPTLEWMTRHLHIKPLAVGKADATNHPELEDPLQDYIVRFETSLVVFDKADVTKLRPAPQTKKSARFAEVLEAEEARMDFPIPAIPWFARQKENPRVMFFANAPIASEAFDFLRRFRCDGEIVEGWSPTGKSGMIIYSGYNIPDPEVMAEKVLKTSPQVIVIPSFTNKALNRKLKKLLVEKVKQGAVVLYISDVNRFTDLFPKNGGKEIPEELFRGIPFKVKIVEHRIGKGKVFFIPFRLYQGGRLGSQSRMLLPVPAPDSPQPEQEHAYALYCRLLRYALGYTSDARILSADVRGEQAEVTIHAERALEGTLNGKAVSLKAGENRIRLPFRKEKLNGTYDLPLLLETEGSSADIFIAQYEVKKLPRILEFAPGKYAHESEENISVRLGLEGCGDAVLTLEDAEGRVIAKEVKKGFSGKGNFTLKPVMSGVNSLCRLTAKVYGKDGLTETRSCTVSRRTPDDSRLRFILWHGSNDSPTYMIRHRRVREMGFTHMLGGQTLDTLDARLCAEAIQQTGGRYMMNTIHRFNQPDIDREKRLRKPCLHDPAGLEKIRKDVREKVPKQAPNFPVAYYSADENSLGRHNTPHDYCFTPHTLGKFRDAMKLKYGTLANLNKKWKRSFKTWDEVVPYTLAEARRTGNFTPWLAHRIFMLSALDSGVAVLREELLKIDPKAKLAHSGQPLSGVNDCWDWRIMLRHYDQSGLYGMSGGLSDLVRSRDPRYSAGNWNGYAAPLDQIRFNCWNDIADGLFAPAYWFSNYFFRRGDNGLNETGLHMKRLISEVRSSGADPLMTCGKREASPFTLVYSPESLIAATATGEKTPLNSSAYTDNYIGWCLLIRSAGYPAPQVIGDDRITEIDPKTTPVLVLPMLQLMSGAQIDHVRKYAENGGILVLDAMPGLFDEFYTLRKENPFHALAGVNITEAQGPADGSVLFGETPVRFTPTGTTAAAAGAVAKGSVAVMIPAARFRSIELGKLDRNMGGAFFVNKTGRGYVIYLNGLLNGIGADLADPAVLASTLKVFREFFTGMGLRPAASAACGVNHSTYVNGRYTVFAVTRRSGSGTEHFVKSLDGEYFLYDTLAHEFIGKSSTIALPLKGKDVRVIAAVKEKLDRPKLTVRFTGRGISAESGSDSGVWRCEILRNGKELRSLARNVILDRGGKTFFDLGLSPSGSYTLKMKNILTGEVISKNFDRGD